ncbi:hypothetical protein GCK72_002472 [Caenorhabditis remanei]|uniref:DUF7107 domain-containing protein n=1 Tax=Caenorhabditis remanei TaxID=31234 RepID=A0A6A5HU36_CAERE|nr:hypothetical protein GCK72_002472 [Caenorhabditis remanei]KAF1770651.1 hypothetical protein GCK72_002472 [Caenorhabditis remanei]
MKKFNHSSADCPGQVCPKGFYCRKGICTLWQPVRKFSAASCRKDSDCSGTDLCSSRECEPVSNFQRSNEMNHCPEENSCEFGLCRYMLDLVFDDQNPKYVLLNDSIAHGMK